MNHKESPRIPMLIDALRDMPKTHRYRVAYSGGADSHALLHGMVALGDALEGAEVSAVHVNHGLQNDADRWAAHAAHICRDLGVSCPILVVDAHPDPGESPEAAARRVRYGAIKGIMADNEILLTAHHLDDQAETLLLQLMRGAGPRGLAAMPSIVRFGAGWLGRPLLGISREVLRDYARAQGLRWVEDHTNRDTHFDRNYLRHEILARLRARWPGVSNTLGRVAVHQARTARQLERLAEEDLVDLRGSEPRTLSCAGLRALSPDRQRNALYTWFRRAKLPMPHAIHIERILNDIIEAASDREPLVSWKGGEVRRYRDDLHAMVPLPMDSRRVIPWVLEKPLRLSHGRLEARRVLGAGLRAASCPGNLVEVRFRQGGEKCRIAARGHTHRLKKLFQENGIPPWERDRIPLIFSGEELAAVAGLWVCHPFEASGDAPGWILRWFPVGAQ
uniref:tRNA(Ile)-lysidine synthase n=1 Tax=Candidatus Kentrum sp. UNK TaxID=2126344 RepID=A0A451AHB1_9GAMM|nr:MAG: tRNA(Ile)-lysidine synthase [Candidatus Kentron sp. UNK]VFK71487.1 MAG: tRNA(Ile)-lysidine synthase [Candidatus Kentron sp. UNK]